MALVYFTLLPPNVQVVYLTREPPVAQAFQHGTSCWLLHVLHTVHVMSFLNSELELCDTTIVINHIWSVSVSRGGGGGDSHT